MAWTDEMVEQLKELWAQGVTTGEIGKRLGISKNSIVGKVHRLGLEGRPSPIKKTGEESAPRPAKKAPKKSEKKTAGSSAKTEAPKETKIAKAPKQEKTKTVEKAKPEDKKPAPVAPVMICIIFPDRRSKSTANNVTENVIQYNIRLICFKKFQIFQQTEGGNDPASGAPQTGSGTSGFDTEDPAESFFGNIGDLFRFFIIFPEIIHHGDDRIAIQQIDRRVCFRVTADLNHFFSETGKRRRKVGSHCGFSDPAFSVNRYLDHNPNISRFNSRQISFKFSLEKHLPENAS